MILALIILFTLLGSVCSIGLASFLLLCRKNRIRILSAALIPYSIGTLLSAAFFGMIPQALKRIPCERAFSLVLGGFLLFFMLEKFALWRHCHEEPCETHTRAGTLILIGDSIHNSVDGIAIAIAFTSSIELGISASIAVIAHEVPQEIGDFAILIESGYSKVRALFLNLMSSLTAPVGAVITYFLLPALQPLVPYLLSISAASFIYIALADLIPGRRVTGGLGSLFWELPLIALGIVTIAVL
jgi:zinc and cadmium transporter